MSSESGLSCSWQNGPSGIAFLRSNAGSLAAPKIRTRFDTPHRPTRDADFLGFGATDPNVLGGAIRKVSAIESDDGIDFDPASVRVEEIREEARYGGLRVKVIGYLGRARCPLQLDVGYGDVVTPGPEKASYPTLLDDVPAPRLEVYPRATVVAENLEAIASLGMANSRMKDYFDLHALAREDAIDPELLGEATPPRRWRCSRTGSAATRAGRSSSRRSSTGTSRVG